MQWNGDDKGRRWCKDGQRKVLLEEDREEKCINIVFTVFDGFQAKKFYANVIKQK